MPLGEASVVQRSKTAHTLLQHPGTIMDRLPTLLIVAEPSTQMEDDSLTTGQLSAHHEAAMQLFSNLRCTLQRALESGLPIVFIASKLVAEQARNILPGNCVVELPQDPTALDGEPKDDFAMAVASGVLACANANGWLILPGHTHMLKAETLQKIAGALACQAIVYPQYKLQQGRPVAFSAEFFSELVRMQSERDLSRLMSRYPAMALDVDDPGVLLSIPMARNPTAIGKHTMPCPTTPH